MHMSRVSISVPDDIVATAKAEGLNISRLATMALTDELERREKIATLDRHLADLERELGPIPDDEADAARRWADSVFGAENPDEQQSA